MVSVASQERGCANADHGDAAAKFQNCAYFKNMPCVCVRIYIRKVYSNYNYKNSITNYYTNKCIKGNFFVNSYNYIVELKCF